MAAKYEMKDSGVEWIGKIPKHWNTLKLKYASWLKGRIGWQGLKSDEYTDEGAYLITGTDFDNGIINWNTCAHISVERFNEDSDIHIQENDLLITKDGTIGKVAVAKNCPDMVSLNSGVMLIRNVRRYKYYDKYLYYILMSEQFHLWYELSQNGASTIKHLYQEQFYNFTFSFPSIPEQTAIASYLDDKCSAIDDVIAQAKETIEEYKSWKASVIFEAVTKGLDPNVEMKDSGVEWIGKIPVHWTVVPLKRLYDYSAGSAVRVGPFGSAITEKDFVEDGVWVYNQRTVLDNNFENNPACINENKANELRNFAITPGDILITTRGSIGKIAIVPENAHRGVLHPCIIRFKINQKLQNKKLLKLIFNDTNLINEQIKYHSNSTTIDVLYSYTLKELRLPLIPSDEQESILAFLSAKCSAIDSIIFEKQVLIDELESYKKSLIFETVTGKRRVC